MGIDPGETIEAVTFTLRTPEERELWGRVASAAAAALSARPETWASEDAAGAAKVADFVILELRKRNPPPTVCAHRSVDFHGSELAGTCDQCGAVVTRAWRFEP